MDDKVELVAQAIHQAEHSGCLWVNEPVTCQDRFREYARNAIDLLKDDISVLLGALERCSGKE
jgi:phage terminase Nu1 subunit (DNA packaging protein)